MELIERDDFLSLLHTSFSKTETGEGHCFFITGEAGIGKTALVKTFLQQLGDKTVQYSGACDSLFTARPLAPLYDLAMQINEDWVDQIHSLSSRAALFTKFVQGLSNRKKPVLLVFEDIHWADEATFDFIKFFARRINRSKCLFILTFRDDEVSQQHSLRNIIGDLTAGTFSRIRLTPLSRQSVYALAEQKGYPAENVYNITGGNPFYVTEILASYSAGVPDNIKDAVLSVYNRQDLNTKNLWQMLSVIPEGLELERIAVINPFWEDAISRCLETKILVYKNDKIYFKHELYRRTIEGSLSPFSRIALNKKILRFFLTTFEEAGDTERIVHYAKNANENNLVVQFAPVAAYKAACVGAHVEASKLWLSAIEYSDGKDSRQLVAFYEAYAYECYLTSQVKDAIIYQGKALKIRKELNEIEKTGNCLRFLSRLWWFEGNRKHAEDFAKQAVDLLEGKAASSEKAMAYSNMSQLKMLSDEMEDCIYWGEKAIEIAREIEDEEPIAHALINMGSSLMTNRPTMMEGISFLHQGLAIGLRNSWHEHVGRAYTALGSNAVTMKDYLFAKTNLDEGISYCEERDLYSLKLYMLCWKARLLLETGNWDEALEIGNNLLKKDDLLPVIKIGALVVAATIKIRRGEDDALSLLNEAKTIAFKTMEPQRIVPALSALLEYEWITGKCFVEKEMVNSTIQMIEKLKKMQNGNRFYYWLDKARKGYLPGKKNNTEQETRCPYEKALILFDGKEGDKRNAIAIIQKLGANAVYEKLKMQMRASGIKNIPRGIRLSTKTNPAQLTNRELDVLLLLQKGVQNKEIAEVLFISPKTVDHHVSGILFKLDASTRLKAVTEAVRLGILK